MIPLPAVSTLRVLPLRSNADSELIIGGPLDSSYLFDNYLESVKRYKDSQAILQPNRDNRPNPLLVDLLAKERVDVVPTLGMENMARANAATGASAKPEARAAAAA